MAVKLSIRVTNDIGRLINERRRRKHLTQEGLAALVHLSSKTIANIERGRSQAGFADMVAILRALDMDVEIVERPPDKYP